MFVIACLAFRVVVLVGFERAEFERIRHGPVVVAVFEIVGLVVVVMMIYTPARGRRAEKRGNFDGWVEFVAFTDAAVVRSGGRRRGAEKFAVEGFAPVAAAEEEGGNTEDEDEEKKAGDAPGGVVGEEGVLPVFGW